METSKDQVLSIYNQILTSTKSHIVSTTLGVSGFLCIPNITSSPPLHPTSCIFLCSCPFDNSRNCMISYAPHNYLMLQLCSYCRNGQCVSKCKK
jgi:hypothetical protein